MTSKANLEKAVNEGRVPKQRLLYALAAAASVDEKNGPNYFTIWQNIIGTNNPFLSSKDVLDAKTSIKVEEIKANVTRETAKTKETEATRKIREANEPNYEGALDSLRTSKPEDFNKFYTNWTNRIWVRDQSGKRVLRPAYRTDGGVDAMFKTLDLAAKRIKIAADTAEKDMLKNIVDFFKSRDMENVPLGDITGDRLRALNTKIDKGERIVTEYGFLNTDGLPSNLRISLKQIKEIFGDPGVIQAINAAALINMDRIKNEGG